MGSLLSRQLPALTLGALCTAIVEWGTTRISPGAVPLYAHPMLLTSEPTHNRTLSTCLSLRHTHKIMCKALGLDKIPYCMTCWKNPNYSKSSLGLCRCTSIHKFCFIDAVNQLYEYTGTRVRAQYSFNFCFNSVLSK